MTPSRGHLFFLRVLYIRQFDFPPSIGQKKVKIYYNLSKSSFYSTKIIHLDNSFWHERSHDMMGEIFFTFYFQIFSRKKDLIILPVMYQNIWWGKYVLSFSPSNCPEIYIATPHLNYVIGSVKVSILQQSIYV